MPNGGSIFTRLSTRRLRLTGSTLPTWGTRVVPYSATNYDAHVSFLRNALGVLNDYDRVTPGSIVRRFDEDPVLVQATARFGLDFIRNCLTAYPQFRQDPETWTLRDKRTMIADKKTNSDGHYIYSGSFEPIGSRDLPKNFRAALHQISGFVAGGGFVIPRELYLDAVAAGRTLQRFPREVFAENATAIRDYNRGLYEQNRSLKGEIVILGNNAVTIRDHAIFELDGATVQVMRPVTLSNHVFYNGQAIWLSAATPDFPHGTAHMYIGQGKSDVSLNIALGDRLNTANGVPTFKDVFRAGNITYENFDALLKKFPDKAALLALDPDVALAIDGLLAKVDWALLWDRKLFTLLDNSLAADITRLYNPYTPPKCSSNEFMALAVARPLAGDSDCDITDVDLDKLIDTLGKNEQATADDLIKALDGFPTGGRTEQLVDASGKPFDVGMYSEALSLPPAEANAVFTDPGLFGSAIDDLIAQQASKALGDEVDWKSVQDAVSKDIARQVGALADATSPFADGSSLSAVSERFSTPEFQQSVREALQGTLANVLGPKASAFPQLLEKLPVFQSASPQVKALLADYPLVTALSNRVFTAMTAQSDGAPSYFQAEMNVALVDSKRAYFSEPSQKSAAQKAITQRITELGDVSNLTPDLAKTAQALAQSQSDLEAVSKALLATPDDPGLEGRRQSLASEVAKELAEQQQLEDQQSQANELDAARAETSDGQLDAEGKKSKQDGESRGDSIFRPGGD